MNSKAPIETLRPSGQAVPARPQIWAVGGGKGGTGKSLLAASLGIHLADSGRRVVLVDGDLGAPNLHTFLGLDGTGPCLGDIVRRTVASLEEAAVETGVPRLRLIGGSRNGLDAESLKHFQKMRLLRLLTALPADVVVVDLGAGTSLNVLDFFSIADRGVLMILPEPTSIENCYRFVRAAFLRRLQQVGRSLGLQSVVDLVLEHRARFFPGRASEILEEIRRIDEGAARRIAAQIDGFLPRLVINQVRDHDDERVGPAIEEASRRFLEIPIRFAGSVPYDPVLVRSVKSRRPYMIEYPRSRTSGAFRAAAAEIAAPWPARTGVTPAGGRAPWEILNVPAAATHHEIVDAYMRLRPILRADSPALISLDCEAARRAALVELEDAFRLLARNLSLPALHPGTGSLPSAPRPAIPPSRRGPRASLPL